MKRKYEDLNHNFQNKYNNNKYKRKKSKKMKIYKQIEKKALTLGITASNVDAATGTIASIFANIGQGIDLDERIGQKMNVHSIQWKIQINLVNTTVLGFGAFDLIQDNKPTGSLPSITDIFNASAPKDLIKYTLKTRFKTLRNQTFSYASYSIDNKGVWLEGYIEFKKPKIVQYTGTSTGTGQLIDGGPDVYYVFRSTNSATGNFSYGVNGDIRVIFSDP